MKDKQNQHHNNNNKNRLKLKAERQRSNSFKDFFSSFGKSKFEKLQLFINKQKTFSQNRTAAPFTTVSPICFMSQKFLKEVNAKNFCVSKSPQICMKNKIPETWHFLFCFVFSAPRFSSAAVIKDPCLRNIPALAAIHKFQAPLYLR